MKRKLLTLVMIFTLSLQVTAYASSVAELTSEQEKVKKDISEVTDKIMDYEDDITKLQSEIDANDKKINDLKAEQDKSKENISELQEEVGATLVLMQRLNNTNMLATYFYDESTLDNNYFLKMENINTMFESVSSDMSTFIVEIEAMQTDIDKADKLSKQNENKLEKLNEKLTEQQELEDSLKQELADIETEIGEVGLATTGGSIGSDKEAIMAAAGISSSDYQYVDYIIKKESGWNYTAQNPMSSAYGLCQSLPGSKMASAGSDWKTNPVTQMKWCDSYATGRYGSWSGAYSFWISNHWW